MDALARLLFPLCMIALTVAAVALWRRLLLTAPRSHEQVGPWCRRCAYALRGLASQSCPECGQALSEPGAIALRPKEHRYGLAAVVLMIVSMLMSAWGTGGALIPEGDRRVIGEIEYSQSASGAYRSINVTFRTGHTTVWPWRSDDLIEPAEMIFVTFDAAPGRAIFATRRDGRWIAHVEPGQLAAVSLDRQSFDRWLAAAEVDPNAPAVAREADHLFDLIRAMSADRWRIDRADSPHFSAVRPNWHWVSGSDARRWEGPALTLWAILLGALAVWALHRLLTAYGSDASAWHDPALTVDQQQQCLVFDPSPTPSGY